MIGTEFYPTPVKVIRKMLDGINLNEINTILEPSAGKGDIVDYISEQYKSTNRWYRRGDKLDIDTVEIDPNLRHILKGKGYRVVHDDFLTLQTYKRYDLIIANPPFSNGEQHLLKMLKMQENGGRVICLLNAETIRNPHTNARMDLKRQLEEYNAEIEYLGAVFSDAERKTFVDVVMIKVSVPPAERSSIILDDLRRTEDFSQRDIKQEAIVDKDFFQGIVARYNYEVRAGLRLMDEYHAMQPLILDSLKGSGSPIIELKVGNQQSEPAKRNAYIEAIRCKYWEALFRTEQFSKIFTSNLRSEYFERIKDLKHYDFSLYNIYSLQAEVIKTMAKSIEDTIIALFEEFSHKYYWDEECKNIRFYNGWKTNKAWIVNKRVIIRLKAWGWNERYNPDAYDVVQKLSDIEKVFDYLDGGVSDHVDLEAALKRAEVDAQTTKIKLKYFNVTFYKKGTCHLEFTNSELLKKFNIFGSQRKGWLPPSYGKTKYEDMSQEEQSVVDEFEGKESYRKTMGKRDYFIYDTVKFPMLESSETSMDKVS